MITTSTMQIRRDRAIVGCAGILLAAFATVSHGAAVAAEGQTAAAMSGGREAVTSATTGYLARALDTIN